MDSVRAEGRRDGKVRVFRKLYILVPVLLLAACARTTFDSSVPATDVPALQPLVSVTFTVLAPWVTSDSLLLADAVERASVRRVQNLTWENTNGRSLRDVMDLVDSPERREQLGRCIQTEVQRDEVVVVRLSIDASGQPLSGRVALSNIDVTPNGFPHLVERTTFHFYSKPVVPPLSHRINGL